MSMSNPPSKVDQFTTWLPIDVRVVPLMRSSPPSNVMALVDPPMLASVVMPSAPLRSTVPPV